MQTQTRRSKKRMWAMVLCGVVAAGVLGLPALASAADDYPYGSGDPSELDERGFYYRHCTSFVAWRMAQRGPFENYMNGGHWYHARHWADNAQQLGFPVDQTPARGAIAHWYAGEGGADSLGHVAFVDWVNGDGSVMVEEYNGVNPYAYSRRGPIHAPRYIHVYDDAAPPAPVEPAPEPEPAAAEPVHDEVVAALAAVPAAAPAEPPSDRAPVGRLTAPAAAAVLRQGQQVTVAGDFEDDGRVTKVHFFAADENYRWTLIGTDDHGGNGTYSVPWSVEYPPGSRVSVRAEAFDDAGHHAVDSIQGLEGIAVEGASVDGKGRRESGRERPAGSHRDVSPVLAAERSAARRSVGSLAVLVPLGALVGLATGIVVSRKGLRGARAPTR